MDMDARPCSGRASARERRANAPALRVHRIEAFPRSGVAEEATMDWISVTFVAVIVLVAEVLGMSFTRN